MTMNVDRVSSEPHQWACHTRLLVPLAQHRFRPTERLFNFMPVRNQASAVFPNAFLKMI